jgi:hypothetical protein
VERNLFRSPGWVLYDVHSLVASYGGWISEKLDRLDITYRAFVTSDDGEVQFVIVEKQPAGLKGYYFGGMALLESEFSHAPFGLVLCWQDVMVGHKDAAGDQETSS